MNNIHSYLEQLGFTTLEAKLYLAIIEAGSMTARDLALKLGIIRTQVYPPLDRLFEKGLISKVIKDSQPHFAGTDPKDSLPGLVTKKAQELQEIKTDLPTILATLEGLQGEETEDDTVEVKYYKGKAGVKKIYREALHAKELRSYVNIEDIAEVFPDNFLLFDESFKDNKDLKMFEICEDSPLARKRIGVSNKNHFYRLLPANMKLTPQDVLIYDKKVAIINLKTKISGVVLYNTDLFNNFKLLFDFLWRMLPELK